MPKIRRDFPSPQTTGIEVRGKIEPVGMKSMKAYHTMQGRSSPPAQVASITNTGEGKLYGNMDWIMDGAETNRAWLSPSLTHRVVSPGQTEQATILVITHGVDPSVH
jgi:hypothetical protein